jgi:hypothetical protein
LGKKMSSSNKSHHEFLDMLSKITSREKKELKPWMLKDE